MTSTPAQRPDGAAPAHTWWSARASGWRRRGDGLLRVTACWIGGGVLLALLTQPLLGWISPFLVLPLWGAYGLVGAVVLLAALIRLVRRTTRPAAAVAIALMAAFAGAMWFGGWRQLVRAGDAVEFRLRFARLAPRYGAMLPEIMGDTVARTGYAHRAGARYVVDDGPPRRVAFLQHGIVDNWEGIVYDPTGVVAQARGWRYDDGAQAFTAPPAVRRLFGGDLVACEHVRDAWYRCWFT